MKLQVLRLSLPVICVSKSSRSRCDGTAIGRALVCNKEGFRMAVIREKIVRQRAETRVGCRAMALVRKVGSGKWVITKYVKEHTHPLTPGEGRFEAKGRSDENSFRL